MKTFLSTVPSFIFGLLLTTTLIQAEPIDHSQSAWNKWSAPKPPENNKWLSLAGLFWLDKGISSIGSAANNTHQFPATAPANIGTIEVTDEGVFFSRPNDNLKIKLEADSDSRVLFDHFSFQIIAREGKYAIRLQDFANPSFKTFKGKSYFAWNKNLLISAKFIPETENKKLKIQTVYGTLRTVPAAGWIEFEIDGKKQRLHAVGGPESETLFVMFKDQTSEKSTYGAGRYMDLDRADKDGNIIIDFNYAYNPPCAITKFATCPLPPKSNRMAVEIKAGEKYKHL